MRIKWDSNAARDISKEMDRLGEALDDCAAEIERCIGILLETGGNDPEGVIVKYTELAGTLKKGVKKLEERCRGTRRGILQANELFEGNELLLSRQAAEMGSGAGNPAAEAGDPGWRGTAPMFYNVPGPGIPPIGVARESAPVAWPMPAGVNRSVVIDHAALGSGMAIVPWLQGLIETDRDRERRQYH